MRRTLKQFAFYHPCCQISLIWSAFVIQSAACGDVAETQEENHDFPDCYCPSVGCVKATAVTQKTQLWQPQWLFWRSSEYSTSSNSQRVVLGMLMSSGAVDGPQWYLPVKPLVGAPKERVTEHQQHRTDRAASCVQPPCHTDQHCWHGVWASIKLYLWSQTAGQTPSHEASAELSQAKVLSSLGKIISGKPNAFHHAVVLVLAG